MVFIPSSTCLCHFLVVPVIVILLAFGVIMAFAVGSAIAPFT